MIFFLSFDSELWKKGTVKLAHSHSQQSLDYLSIVTFVLIFIIDRVHFYLLFLVKFISLPGDTTLSIWPSVLLAIHPLIFWAATFESAKFSFDTSLPKFWIAKFLNARPRSKASAAKILLANLRILRRASRFCNI